MAEVTLKSNEARNHWGEMLNTAAAGGRVVIRRRNKPQVVLVSYAQWEKLQQRLQVLEGWAAARRISDEMNANPKK
jgi:prevent-host-death family protein